MKAKFISMTLVILLVAVSFTYATDSRIKNSYFALGYKNTLEQELYFENRISDDCCRTFFNNCSFSDYFHSLSLESRMNCTNLWEDEEPFKMESRMKNDQFRNISQGEISYTSKKNTTIESGMTDKDFWKYAECFPIEFEGLVNLDSWMIDDHIWCNEFTVTVFTSE